MTQNTAVEAWVDRFRDDRDNQYVSEQHVQRAAAIIRLIGTSALDRGFAVPPPDDGDLLRLHREDATWAHIVCATDDGVTYFLRVQEVCAPNAPRKPPATVGADPDEPRWLAYRIREFVGTGLLQIAIRADGDAACRRTAEKNINWQQYRSNTRNSAAPAIIIHSRVARTNRLRNPRIKVFPT